MADKLLHEVRLIETDDGFRIEVKGDKEHMKAMGFGPRMFGMGLFGPRMRGFGRRKRMGRGGHGRHGHRGHHGRGRGPWAWGKPDGEPSPEKEPTVV